MRKLLLDSSFLISVAREKIDLFENLQEYEILVPEQVIEETFKISQKGESKSDKDAAQLALNLLYEHRKQIQRIDIGEGHTDNNIIKLAEQDKSIIVATLDKEIRNQLKGRCLIFREKNKFEVI